LKQIKLLSQTLESKMQTLHQFLPSVDRKQGLINIGGTILKTLFGTASVLETDELHNIFDELESRNSD
jgi:hypothetical protein